MTWLPEGASSIAGSVDALFYLILGITGFFLLLVLGCLVYAIVRFREGRVQRARYSRGSSVAEFVVAGVVGMILVTIALYSENLWERIRRPAATDPFVVRIEPRQFQWDVRYAGVDEEFGTDDDVQKINLLRLPRNRWSRIEMEAQDVIHSFFVPEFRIKQDAVPGLLSTILVMPTDTGTFEIACAELCGLAHYRMRGKLTVMEPEAFNVWYRSTTQAKVQTLSPAD